MLLMVMAVTVSLALQLEEAVVWVTMEACLGRTIVSARSSDSYSSSDVRAGLF